jgi:hypothetical protein
MENPRKIRGNSMEIPRIIPRKIQAHKKSLFLLLLSLERRMIRKKERKSEKKVSHCQPTGSQKSTTIERPPSSGNRASG